MSTIVQSRGKCPVCHAERHAIIHARMEETGKVQRVYPGVAFAVMRCSSCGTVFTDPQLAYGALSSFFDESYGPFRVAGARNAGVVARILALLKRRTLGQYFGYGEKRWWQFSLFPFRLAFAHYPRFVKGGRLLDLGCGAGNFLADLKGLGWETFGVDPSPIAVASAVSQGLKNISVGSVDTLEFSDGFFDAVHLLHVFEHFPDPAAALRELNRVLKPGGVLVIGVPQYGGISSIMCGKWWDGFVIPLHYVHYRKATFQRLFKEAGFSLEKTYSTDFFSNLFSSFETMCGTKWPVSRSWFGKKPVRMIKRVLGLCDYFPGNSIANMFGLGAQITVIARKTADVS